MKIYDVAIIGAGPVGLFAGFQCGLNNMRAIIIDTLDIIGGQCALLYPEKNIYDIPGHHEITGKTLIDNLKKQCDRFNHEFLLQNQVLTIEKIDNIFQLKTDKNIIILAKTILISAGNGAFTPNKPDIPDIAHYENKSIFYLINDIQKFKDKVVAIAGGGDSAVDWSSMLIKNKIAKKVYFIHRRHDMRCHPNSLAELHALSENGDLEFQIPYVVEQLIGNCETGELHEISLKNFNNQELKTSIKVDYFLPFFGLINDMSIIKNWGLEINKNKICVDYSSMATNVEGIFASGDICSYNGKTKLLVSGFHESAVACNAIDQYLVQKFDKKAEAFYYSTSKFN